MTSWWAWWRLKSPASRLFAQQFVQVQFKENIKASRHWPFWGESIGDQWIPLRKKRPVTRKMFPFDDVIKPSRVVTADLIIPSRKCLWSLMFFFMSVTSPPVIEITRLGERSCQCFVRSFQTNLGSLLTSSSRMYFRWIEKIWFLSSVIRS